MGVLGPEEVRVEMSKSLALLLPSEWYEGFPMVLVEAFASGLPVIASRIGALPELIEHGVTGLLFEPGDPQGLASALLWASENPEEMSKMGCAARRRYEERYAEPRNHETLMRIYRSAMDGVRA